MALGSTSSRSIHFPDRLAARKSMSLAHRVQLLAYPAERFPAASLLAAQPA
jgi:hypothetical protein